MFKEGDKVWSIIRGWGEVSKVDNDCTYHVHVEFVDGEKRTYTSEGKYHEETARELYFDEFEIHIPQSALERPRWRAKKKESYLFVNEFGHVIWAFESNFYEDDLRFKSTNYFQTMEEAKESKFYKVFNEELD